MTTTPTEPSMQPVTEASGDHDDGTTRTPMGTKGKVAATGLVLAVLVGGGIAVNNSLHHSSTGSSTASGPGSGTGGPGGSLGSGGFGGAGAPASGTIAAVSATSISVKSSSGTVKTYQLSSSTAVENNSATSTVGQLKVGEKVIVFLGVPGSSSATTATTTASRILAGTSAVARTGAPSGAAGPAGAGAPSGAGNQPA